MRARASVTSVLPVCLRRRADFALENLENLRRAFKNLPKIRSVSPVFEASGERAIATCLFCDTACRVFPLRSRQPPKERKKRRESLVSTSRAEIVLLRAHLAPQMCVCARATENSINMTTAFG